jgi:hypothetical protein
MKQMKLRKHVLVALLGIVAGCGILFGALFAAVHSPWLLNRLAIASGYEVNARTISLSPSLSGSISGLSIKRLGDDSLTLLASNVTAKSSLNMILRGEVDSLVLQNPKVTFRIGKESKGTADLSFLEKLPRIRLLDIQNAEVLLTFEEGSGQQDSPTLTLPSRISRPRQVAVLPSKRISPPRPPARRNSRPVARSREVSSCRACIRGPMEKALSSLSSIPENTRATIGRFL